FLAQLLESSVEPPFCGHEQTLDRANSAQNGAQRSASSDHFWYFGVVARISHQLSGERWMGWSPELFFTAWDIGLPRIQSLLPQDDSCFREAMDSCDRACAFTLTLSSSLS